MSNQLSPDIIKTVLYRGTDLLAKGLGMGSERRLTEENVHRIMDDYYEEHGRRPTHIQILAINGSGSAASVSRHARTWRSKDDINQQTIRPYTQQELLIKNARLEVMVEQLTIRLKQAEDELKRLK